jgi:hypothetical protein
LLLRVREVSAKLPAFRVGGQSFGLFNDQIADLVLVDFGLQRTQVDLPRSALTARKCLVEKYRAQEYEHPKDYLSGC